MLEGAAVVALQQPLGLPGAELQPLGQGLQRQGLVFIEEALLNDERGVVFTPGGRGGHRLLAGSLIAPGQFYDQLAQEQLHLQVVPCLLLLELLEHLPEDSFHFPVVLPEPEGRGTKQPGQRRRPLPTLLHLEVHTVLLHGLFPAGDLGVAHVGPRHVKGTPAYEHHVKTYGPQKEFGYKDFIPLFRAEKFDPAAWAELFQRAGARYVVPVAEHHDGFQMYQSKLSHWNAGEMGPKRDVVGQLKAAVEDRGMTLGVSSHRIEHWFFMGEGRKFDSDVPENAGRDDLYWPAMPIPENTDSITGEPGPSEEFLNDWLVRTCELIDNYHPRILYFDWWIQHVNAKPYLKKLAAYYYNRAAEWGIEVALNCKYDAFLFGTAVLDIERGQMADIKPYFWQTDTAVALNSWGYTEGNQFRPAGDIIQDLVDIVSKNGCLLLNVGPKSDGTISQEDTQILMEIGDWLAVNGEAIYDTHVWKTFGEGPTQVLRVVYDLVIILLGYAFGAPFAAVTLAMAFLLGPAVSLVGKWLDCWIFLRPASPDSKKGPA